MDAGKGTSKPERSECKHCAASQWNVEEDQVCVCVCVYVCVHMRMCVVMILTFVGCECADVCEGR